MLAAAVAATGAGLRALCLVEVQQRLTPFFPTYSTSHLQVYMPLPRPQQLVNRVIVGLWLYEVNVPCTLQFSSPQSSPPVSDSRFPHPLCDLVDLIDVHDALLSSRDAEVCGLE